MKLSRASIVRKRFQAIISALAVAAVLVTGFSVGPWSTVASADSWDEMTNNCHLMKPEGDQLHQVGYALYTTRTGEIYGWTKELTVPSGSACEDINLGALKGWYDGFLAHTCGDFRVRFTRSDGTFSYSSWREDRCTGSGAFPIATNVLNGTKYRIEFKEARNYNDTFYFYIWD